MELFSCEHPVRVYNKYIDEYVHVSCGKCNACKKRRSSKWVFRLERERAASNFCFFVTLTYNEQSLPLLVYSEDHEYLCSNHGEYSIPFSELEFSSAPDREYFDKMMALRGIPYASIIDIQKFHKRLNKYFHDHVTQTYKNFRWFCVSEYGSTTLRPHFHSIYFVQDQRVADHFQEGISACWTYGINDCQYVEKSANSYVAQYLNELFSLPSFYQHRKIRPFFTCSRRPPLGGDLYIEDEFKHIFESAAISTVKSSSPNDTTLSSVPLLPCVENRIFPRIKAFDRIDHTLRTSLYGFVREGFRCLVSFEDFKWRVYGLVCGPRSITAPMRDVVKYLSLLVHGFCESGINALKRFYYTTKRVCLTCLKYSYSIDYYVSQIELYWSKKSLYVLRNFYSSQSSVSDPEELVHCYPELVYRFIHPKDGSKLPWILPLEYCRSYRMFVENNDYAVKKVTKSHFKNAYFQSLEDKNNPLFQILLSYYYAKECYEAIETFT